MADRPHLPPFSALRAFEAFGRHRKVRRTASALGVSHAIVSRHLRALEDWLGTMLVDRDSGGLTAAGEAYHALISPAFDQLCTATEQARTGSEGGSGGRLDLWSVPGFAYLWLTGHLPAFSQRYPGTALDLRPSDRAPDLLRREAQADIRWTADEAPPPARGLTRTEIVRPPVFPVVSPQALWLRGRLIAGPDDVLALPMLHEDSDHDWRGWVAAQGLTRPLPVPAARLWQAHMTLAAACDGQGVALTNRVLAADHLARGELIELGARNRAFRTVTLGAYTLTARTDAWDSAAIHRLRAWLGEMLGSGDAL